MKQRERKLAPLAIGSTATALVKVTGPSQRANSTRILTVERMLQVGINALDTIGYNGGGGGSDTDYSCFFAALFSSHVLSTSVCVCVSRA